MKNGVIIATVIILVLTAFNQIKKQTGKMESRFSTLTVGVDDLGKSYKFYHDALGFPSKGIIGKEFEHGEIAFFDLKNGMTLALYSRENLAWDAHLKTDNPSSTEFSIGYNTRSEAEADSILLQAQKAGATIVKPAQKTFWGGYSGYFKDPDGHLWEIVYNPEYVFKD